MNDLFNVIICISVYVYVLYIVKKKMVIKFDINVFINNKVFVLFV